MAAENIIVVFDFDKTIIDCDSDNWVVDELGATDLFNQLLPTMPWNSLMDTMMKELHSQGTTIEDIVDVLKRTPMHPQIVPAIQSAHSFGCDLKIVSDANVFFIETILEHLGIKHCFSEIHTNPSFVDEEGRLRILPHHDFHTSSHCCPLCPPNMCKGMVMEKMQTSIGEDGKKKMIYIGDGSGDFCPSLKLKEEDYLMPRKEFPLWELICKNPRAIKGEIQEWKDGEELQSVLVQIINKIISRDQQQNSTANDSKLKSINNPLAVVAVAGHEQFRPSAQLRISS